MPFTPWSGSGSSGGISQQAYQFTPETYGAKRNGAFLYDVAMTNGSAVLTTSGLPAPATPAPTNSGSGGTVLAGTYQVRITYVNQYGESLPSAAGSTTTVGSTSTITVPTPAPWTNATAYYVYCTQAGGVVFTRQQPAGSPTPLRTAYVITAPPSNSGAAPPVSNTSASSPFTSGDVGKSIIVLSAGGFLNVPLITTIASYQSAGQVTLATIALSTVTSYGAVYGNDDTSAIQQAINAAVAYAQTAGTEQGTGEVIFSNGIYCVAGAPGGTYQNAQIQIPFIDPYVGPKVNLKLTGPQESNAPVHWEQPNPVANGCTLAAIYYNDSGTPLSPPQTVMGGPATGPFGGNGGLFSNMRVIVDGVNVLVAYRPSINGLDLYGVGQADIKSFGYFAMARTSTAAGGWPPYTGGVSNPAPWQVAAYRTPTLGNNDLNTLDRLTVYGPWIAIVATDHFTAQSVTAIYCYAATLWANQFGGAHHCFIASLSSEVTSRVVWATNTTPYGNNQNEYLTIASAHIENADVIIDDAANVIYGAVRAEMLGLPASPPALVPGGKTGAANVTLVWDGQTLGHVGSPPAVPASGTALTNSFWQPAAVSIHTGAGVTVSIIALDGTATGLTMAASSSLTIPVRNGGTITLTYAGGTPTWDWVIG